MEEWKEYKLYEIADVQTGPFGSQLHNEDYVPEGTPIVTVEHLGSRKFTYQNLPKVSEKDRLRLSKYTMSIGDIIFSRVGSVDRCSYVDLESNGWMFSGRCLRIHVLNQDEVNTLFLYYYFCIKEIKQHLRNIAVGATMPSLNTKLLNNINICIPSKECQDAIAKILGSIDDKIELNNRINANLEEQAQALFRRWFVDFEFPNEQGLPYKSNDGKFVNSELGSIPEGWSVKAIADVAELMAGGDKPCIVTKKPTGECNVPIFSNGMSDDGLYGYTTNAKGFKESVTISARGTIGFVRLRQKPFFPIVRLITAIPNTSFISAKYLYFLLLDKNISGTGTTQQQLTVPDFRRYELIVPTLNIIKNFNNITNVVYNKITFLKHENEILESLRDAILPKLMNNELRP